MASRHAQRPIPAHVLSVATILLGLTILITHILHHRSRRLVYLPPQRGSIATAVSQTAHSGFGQLLMPYDDEKRIAKKLEGLRFRLDRRTGAIVVDDEAVFHAAGGRMEAVNEEGKLGEEEEEGSASASGGRTR